jgi:hypothetical protein
MPVARPAVRSALEPRQVHSEQERVSALSALASQPLVLPASLPAQELGLAQPVSALRVQLQRQPEHMPQEREVPRVRQVSHPPAFAVQQQVPAVSVLLWAPLPAQQERAPQLRLRLCLAADDEPSPRHQSESSSSAFSSRLRRTQAIGQ